MWIIFNILKIEKLIYTKYKSNIPSNVDNFCKEKLLFFCLKIIKYKVKCIKGVFMKNFIIKKCLKCGAMVEVIEDCTCPNCGIKCCGENMSALTFNSVDASHEKHIPVCKVEDNKIYVCVPHAMEQQHFIMWIACVSDGRVEKVFLNPNMPAEAVFDYHKNTSVYAYCNNHGLWKTDVE